MALKQTIVEDKNVSTNASFVLANTENLDDYSVQVVLTGVDYEGLPDAVFKIQDSEDGTNFNDVVDCSGNALQLTPDLGSSALKFRIVDLVTRNFKIDFFAGSAFTGTYSIYLTAKSNGR